MKAESPSTKAPVVVAALPFAFREGVDEYDGVMRFLYEKGLQWDLRVVRHSFSAELFRGISADELSGVILGLDYKPGIDNYNPYVPIDVLDDMEKKGIPVVTLDFPPDIVESRKHCSLVRLLGRDLPRTRLREALRPLYVRIPTGGAIFKKPLKRC